MKKILIAAIAVLASFGLGASAFAAATTTATSTPGVHISGKNHPKFKTVQGTVQALNGSSFTLTVRSTDYDYTVNATSSTRIVNRNWKHITLSDLQVGNNVRVYGSFSGTTIAARIIRDISLPVAASSTKSHS